MKLMTLLVITSTFLLSACQSMIESSLKFTPSAKAGIIIETVHAKDVESCQLLGNVTGSSMPGDVGGDKGSTSMNNAVVEAKEKAAKLDATHILFDTLKPASIGGSKVAAKVYRYNN